MATNQRTPGRASVCIIEAQWPGAAEAGCWNLDPRVSLDVDRWNLELLIHVP
jgi:hypothetical protein